jgi:CPA2 family monovalent cation:H+ antiporter-2
MVVLLPSLLSGHGASAAGVGVVVAEAAGFLLVTYVFAARAVPWLLGHLAVPRTRELFLLAVVTLALGSALVAQAIGLSLAFGAFVAGLVVAESDYRSQVVAEVLPLRDLFTSLFFVSVGMLIDPALLLANAPQIGLLTAAVVAGKVLLVTAVVTALGMPGRVALLAGLAIAQVGEFSFVLGKVGVDAGAISPRLFDLVLATSLTTIVLAPFLLRAAPLLLAGLRRLPLVGRRFEEPAEADLPAEGLRRHAVICGYGRVGRELGAALARRSIPFVVIDYNPDVVRELREQQVPVVFGDASNPAVLQHASLERARLVAALVPDPVVTELIVRRARAASRRLDIVARGTDVERIASLREAGADEVVQPEFEAGIEVIRHALARYGVTGPELSLVLSGRRAAFYGEPGRR